MLPTRKPKPESFSDEVGRFLETFAAAGSCAQDLRTTAPWLDQRLREMDRERNAIVTALAEIPVGRRVPAPTVLRRIRTLAKAENRAVFECYWHDLGGEGGA